MFYYLKIHRAFKNLASKNGGVFSPTLEVDQAEVGPKEKLALALVEHFADVSGADQLLRQIQIAKGRPPLEVMVDVPQTGVSED